MLKHRSKLDLELFEKCQEVLRPLKDVTTLMSSQTNTTSSLVKPLLHQLMLAAKPQTEENSSLHQAKATLYHDLEKRYVVNIDNF